MLYEVGVVARLEQLFPIACFLALPHKRRRVHLNAVHCYLRNSPEWECRSIRYKHGI
jgi:hypothetical protein